MTRDAGTPPPAVPAHVPAPVPAPALWPFGVLAAAYFAVIGLFSPYAPLWFQSVGCSALVIGSIASLQSWTRVVGPYAWSWAGDHGGRRVELMRAAAAGALLAAAGLALLPAPKPALALLALLTGLLFLANSGVMPLYEATLTQALQSGAGFDAARYGRVRVWGSVGFIVAVSVFGVVLQALGTGTFPALLVAMSLLLLGATLRLPVLRDNSPSGVAPPPVLPLLRQPAVAWFFASAFFTVLAHAALYAFFSLYLVALGHGQAVVGVLWAVSVAAEILFFWTQGRFFGRLTPHRWLEVAAAATALRFAATASGAAWMPVLVGAQLLHGLTFAAHHAACIALVQRHFPGRLRGRGQALYSILGYGLSGVIGGVGGGMLVERLGFAAVFWAATACALLAWTCARRSANCERATPH